MKVNTAELQDLVTRVSKGAGNNKLIPITSLVNILVADGTLLLTTTDATNYFTVRLEGVESDPFSVSVNVDVFTKLVQKMTSETISLEVLDNCLMVVGNGRYKIDLLIDETGNPVQFPSKTISNATETGEISVAEIKKVINNNKASLSTDATLPFLQNYYCGTKVMTTDRFKICETGTMLFNNPILISSFVMELIALFTDEYISYAIGEDAIEFDASGEYLYAPLVEGIEKVPVDGINQLINNNIPNTCSIYRDDVLAVLDRLSLFVSPYDKNVIYLSFKQDGIEITSKRSNGAEKVSYADTKETVPEFTCGVDIEMLRSQLTTINEDKVDLYYGSDMAIKFVTEDAVRLIALQA